MIISLSDLSFVVLTLPSLVRLFGDLVRSHLASPLASLVLEIPFVPSLVAFCLLLDILVKLIVP